MKMANSLVYEAVNLLERMPRVLTQRSLYCTSSPWRMLELVEPRFSFMLENQPTHPFNTFLEPWLPSIAASSAANETNP